MKYKLTALAMLLTVAAGASAEEQYPQLSDLPTLYVETEGGVAIPSKKEPYVRATLRLVDGENTTVYDALGIRGRGNSTWTLAKKPYRIKFDKKQRFLGDKHANAKSWTLLANHGDKTLMRNAVAAYIGDFAGQPFTAAAEFVDLVVNGTFLGNYQISDQMEIRSKRVDIVEQDEPATSESNITGGYFLEVDGFAYDEEVYFNTNRGVAITIKSPDDDIINQRQINYIRGYINLFENALFSANFADPTRGYRKYVDEATLASWYISSELTGNVDAFWSTYIYKDRDDPKIYWGPLWDYDIAFNNCNRTGDVSRSLMTERGFGDDLTKLWVKRMWQDPWFANLINDTWRRLVKEGIERHVLDYIDALAARLDRSQALNFSKWKINERAYNEIELFDTYGEGVDYLKKFISDHTAYLTAAFATAAASFNPPVPFESDTDYYYTISNRGCGSLVDVDGRDGLCIWRLGENRDSQHWRFVPDGEGYYTIVNRADNRVVADAARLSGSSYLTGSQLTLADADDSDPRQKWSIAPASGENGAGYIITNRLTGLAWNNSGGNSDDGNNVISWTSDSNNPSKLTRQWYIGKSVEADSGITDITADDDGPARYYDLAGREVSDPAPGIYIVRQGTRTFKTVVR